MPLLLSFLSGPLLNNLTLVNRTETLPGISDHDAVFAEIDIRPKRYGQAKRKIPLYKKADWEGIASQINTSDLIYTTIIEKSPFNEMNHTYMRRIPGEFVLEKHTLSC